MLIFTEEMFTAIPTMKPFWTKRLSYVFQNTVRPGLWDDKPQEFNSITYFYTD